MTRRWGRIGTSKRNRQAESLPYRTMKCVLPTNDPYLMLNGSVGVQLDNNGNTVVTSSLAATLDLLQSTSNFIILDLTNQTKSDLGTSFGDQEFKVRVKLNF